MAAAHADGVFMLKRAFLQRGQQLVHADQQQISGAGQLYVETGIEHVRRGHALMHETRFVAADMFGEVCEEGDFCHVW